jgi:hypothetical protein
MIRECLGACDRWSRALGRPPHFGKKQVVPMVPEEGFPVSVKVNLQAVSEIYDGSVGQELKL